MHGFHVYLSYLLLGRESGWLQQKKPLRPRSSVSQSESCANFASSACQPVSLLFFLSPLLTTTPWKLDWGEGKKQKTNKQPPASPKTELLCRCHVPPARRKALPRPSSFSSPLSFFSTCLSVTGRLSCCRVLLACLWWWRDGIDLCLKSHWGFQASELARETR